MIAIFKTNNKYQEDANFVLQELKKHYTACKATLDLEDCDKVLRIEGIGFTIKSIIKVISDLGYYCNELE